MDKARDALIQDARELLEIMEPTPARVAQDGEHSASVNEIFRVAHTIKGSASLFSFERLVSFTHLLESMLERIRSESLALDTPTVALLVECGDYIAELVDAIAAQREHTEPDPERRARLEEAMGSPRRSASRVCRVEGWAWMWCASRLNRCVARSKSIASRGAAQRCVCACRSRWRSSTAFFCAWRIRPSCCRSTWWLNVSICRNAASTRAWSSCTTSGCRACGWPMSLAS